MANFCKFCGKPIEICTCGMSAKSGDAATATEKKMKIGERIGIPNEKEKIKAYERGKKIVPDCILANENEVPIKQYDIARLRTISKIAFAEGRLQVTNQRVIFRSTGLSLLGPQELQYEFAINEIAGVEVRKDYRLGISHVLISILLIFWTAVFAGNLFEKFSASSSFLSGLFALVLFAASLFLCVAFKGKHFLKLFLLAFSGGALSVKAFTTLWLVVPVLTGGFFSLIEGICAIAMLVQLLLTAFVPNLVLEFKTKGASSPIEIRRKESKGIYAFMLNMPKKEYTGYSDVMPGKDAEKAIKELGALINDINILGDRAVNKWEEK